MRADAAFTHAAAVAAVTRVPLASPRSFNGFVTEVLRALTTRVAGVFAAAPTGTFAASYAAYAAFEAGLWRLLAGPDAPSLTAPRSGGVGGTPVALPHAAAGWARAAAVRDAGRRWRALMPSYARLRSAEAAAALEGLEAAAAAPAPAAAGAAAGEGAAFTTAGTARVWAVCAGLWTPAGALRAFAAAR